MFYKKNLYKKKIEKKNKIKIYKNIYSVGEMQ